MKQNAIWDYFQVSGSESFAGSSARLAFIRSLLPPQGKILNIGVGGGQMERMLNLDTEVYCLDPSEVAIEKIRTELALGERAQVGYSQNIPFDDEMFDGVVMSEVLEHLSDEVLRETLAEVRRVLKVGAVFVGTVPADETLSEQDVVCPECSHKFHRWGHVQTFTIERIDQILRSEFSVNFLRVKAFTNRSPHGLKGRLAAIARSGLFQLKIGPYSKNANLVFRCSK